MLGSYHDTHYPNESRKLVVNMRNELPVNQSLFLESDQRGGAWKVLVNKARRRHHVSMDKSSPAYQYDPKG